MHASDIVPPQGNQRLIAGLVVSLLLHAAVVASVGGVKVRDASFHTVSTPLEVALVRESPFPTTEAVVVQPAVLSAEVAEIRPFQPASPQAAKPAQSPLESNAISTAPSSSLLQLNVPPDKYFSAREVDVRAEQINEVDLVYPRRAYEMRVKGKVMLRLFINEEGGLDNVVILDSTPAGIFDEAALNATLALQFRPAIKANRNVKSIKTIEVFFDPYESINIP